AATLIRLIRVRIHQTPTVVLTRFASKKSGGSSKNLGGKSAGRRYGYKKQDGNFVHAGNILATQRKGLMRWQPGAHVRCLESNIFL
uniref:39S ribosomal protein L27, mitochondrial n=1 Tax=Sinocyclocheilus rhinocerous TaxID=307959 RepID=A0A673L1U9_9TELE